MTGFALWREGALDRRRSSLPPQPPGIVPQSPWVSSGAFPCPHSPPTHRPSPHPEPWQAEGEGWETSRPWFIFLPTVVSPARAAQFGGRPLKAGLKGRDSLTRQQG